MAKGHGRNAMIVLRTDLMPLRVDASGTICVGNTGVSLDVVVADYLSGKSPEEIVRQLDTLNLADVHAAIAYYLRYRDEVEGYLRQRREQADALQRTIATTQP